MLGEQICEWPAMVIDTYNKNEKEKKRPEVPGIRHIFVELVKCFLQLQFFLSCELNHQEAPHV